MNDVHNVIHNISNIMNHLKSTCNPCLPSKEECEEIKQQLSIKFKKQLEVLSKEDYDLALSLITEKLKKDWEEEKKDSICSTIVVNRPSYLGLIALNMMIYL